ncbi:MAG: type II toxin-antitoxin system VapC family toxin [Acidobacteria bacterium]|nr:type II toxin-antitoxin system VapC family toxin [Acidobacteriota bacterium]MBV9068412.1 type II toxin-antitoxin system VapC family toxin [Acidobacteriota bacterium]MBV9186112.1 type II toxin-antitoxin system VapC family toxin [Acidobacteriota bacterium]
MKYLLDANAVIALLKDVKSKTARRARRQKPGDIGVSAIVIHELYYGAHKSQRVALNVAAIEALRFSVVDFDEDDARNAGELRALLASRGTPVGPYDVLIAGQAKSRKLTLVTGNTAEFARVPDLRIEDWERARGKKR